jgi:KDO2-lipid IV(A) lauroyltransferase
LFNYVLRYRKKVVIENLSNSFPEKSKAEIKQITNKFYKNLGDIMVESAKGFSISKQKMIERYKVVNPELLIPFFRKDQDIMLVGSHYANWEWGIKAISLQIHHVVFGLYKPFTNKYIDNYVKSQRAHWGTRLISIYATKEAFEEKRKYSVAYAFVSDQSPSNVEKAHWVQFLNQDTACLHGIEKYSKLYKLPIIYVDVQRIKRGFYTCELSILFESTLELTEGEVTRAFMKKLEDIILERPENWLWSHKRWKHKRTK